MPRSIVRMLATLAIVVAVGWTFLHWSLRSQGHRGGWDRLAPAEVVFDEHHIPTIEAPDWPTLVEAQGYVTASERLWQMDLMRRAAGGRLAEWFSAAVLLDEKRRLEGWPEAAERAAAHLPDEQRHLCDRYAAGVGRFITDHPGSWGIEYRILGISPQPWSCADTMLIALSMAEELASSWSRDAMRARWKTLLPDDWYRLLFTTDHPWNEPLFGEKRDLELPVRPLPSITVDAIPKRSHVGTLPAVPGSNNWGWNGPTGSFLANDPHLGANVPHLWFLARLRIDKDTWVVGATIPGVPGVIIGMNPHLAWVMTNVGEDVDDLVREHISADGKSYLRLDENGAEVWQPIEYRVSQISVKDGPSVEAVARFTDRGPLLGLDHLAGEYSRQWLPLQQRPELARLWTIEMAKATDWQTANAALDGFTFPAQNVLIMDRSGNLGYRATGTGIRRNADGSVPLDGVRDRWLELEPTTLRPRKLLAATNEPTRIVTANQRIWVDDQGHSWTSDRRAARIREVLDSRTDHTREDMERLQLDTHSRYHRIIVGWVSDRTDMNGEDAAAMLARWRQWDGMALANQPTFAEALDVEEALVNLLIDRVKHEFVGTEDADLQYVSHMRDAWVLAILTAPDGMSRFGLDDREVADYLVTVGLASDRRYIVDNRWQAQHPFVDRVPILGHLFRVDEDAQWGHSALVRVERPKFGASFRVVWDLRKPANSTWITPIGQSGHVGSRHYRDLQPLWRNDRRLPVFDAVHDWGS